MVVSFLIASMEWQEQPLVELVSDKYVGGLVQSLFSVRLVMVQPIELVECSSNQPSWTHINRMDVMKNGLHFLIKTYQYWSGIWWIARKGVRLIMKMTMIIWARIECMQMRNISLSWKCNAHDKYCKFLYRIDHCHFGLFDNAIQWEYWNVLAYFGNSFIRACDSV